MVSVPNKSVIPDKYFYFFWRHRTSNILYNNPRPEDPLPVKLPNGS